MRNKQEPFHQSDTCRMARRPTWVIELSKSNWPPLCATDYRVWVHFGTTLLLSRRLVQCRWRRQYQGSQTGDAPVSLLGSAITWSTSLN